MSEAKTGYAGFWDAPLDGLICASYPEGHAATVAVVNTAIHFVPFYSSTGGTVEDITFSSTVGGSAAVAVYDTRGDGWRLPGAKIADFGTLSLGIGESTVTGTAVVSPGVFWVAIKPVGSAPSMRPTMRGALEYQPLIIPYTGSSVRSGGHLIISDQPSASSDMPEQAIGLSWSTARFPECLVNKVEVSA